MSELELLEHAIEIAVQAHKGQKDRYGAPFILHPLRVMARVNTPQERTVAILHDLVEKTNWTFERLKQAGFPDEVLKALGCLTKHEDEAYDAFVRRSAGNALARRVKIADLEDNLDPRRMVRIADEDRARLQRYLDAWLELTQKSRDSSPGSSMSDA